ncbi:MAG: hypothetical protein AMJ53_18330 [Gammaproteobacteria bacterium SG8_11]|nr:MAG: hypothetical protein AMJ53_18330 [Gammaproteobacteria bacterium SG8_11]
MTATPDAPNPQNDSEPIQPIPLHIDFEIPLVELGKQLFNDRRLGNKGNISCADCHNLSQGGADAQRFTASAADPEYLRNTPTIYNVVFNKSYYWTGQFTSLDAQLDDAIKELGVNWEQLIAKLKSNAPYVTEFKRLFPAEEITISTVKQTLIAYERSLITPNSRFDLYLRGDPQALNSGEKKGYALFKSYGCAACHQGINVGGNLVIDWEDFYGKPSKMEKQILQSGNSPTKHNRLSLGVRGNTKIRVPSLRNVALTAPYFHDGSADTLEQAVTIMAKGQLGVHIPHNDVKLIAVFLRTLTGEYNGKAL